MTKEISLKDALDWSKTCFDPEWEHTIYGSQYTNAVVRRLVREIRRLRRGKKT